ncbi:MAG: DUF2703 domain-containing protein [Pseudomonadota bacterium]
MTDQPQPTHLEIEYLYLDLSHCTRCQDTRAELLKAIDLARPTLAALGAKITLRETHVTTATQAREAGFTLSPTIRINGRDIQPARHMSECQECGDLCNCQGGLSCREWEAGGTSHLAPPPELILAAIFGELAQTSPAQPPSENITEVERFFAAPSQQPNCCAPGCCG